MSPLSYHGEIKNLKLRSVTRNNLFKPSLVLLLILVGTCLNQAWAQDADNRVYLRYQGYIEGANDVGNTIDCLFEFLDSSDIAIHRERNPNVLVINNAFTVTLGARDPLEATAFLGPVKLLTQCDLDRDGDYDVITNEIVGNTPKAAVALSVKGTVDADYISVNGTEVVSPDGEWLGSVVTDQDLRASSLEVSSANVSDTLTSLNGKIEELSVNRLTHRVTPDAEASTLIDSTGTWVGTIALPDQDQDGVLDWIEELLGTDPQNSDSQPIDENQDGIFDQLQANQQQNQEPDEVSDLPFDAESFTQRFTFNQSATEFFAEQVPGEAWTVANLNIDADIDIESLQLEFSLSHLSGVHFVTVQLQAPNGDLFTLVNQELNTLPEDIETQKTYLFSAITPPEGIDWNQVIQEENQARSLLGTWQLILRNDSNDGVAPTVGQFTLEAEYISNQEIGLTRDLNLHNTYRVTGLATPQQESDASTKAYVDQALVQLTESLNAQQGNDASNPDGMVYRYRTFEVYDVSSTSYLFPNHPEFFAGQGSAFWGSGLVRASQLEIDALDDFLNQVHKAKQNAVVVNQVYTQENEAQGFFTVFHTQVENSTDASITWNINPHFSCNNNTNGIHQVTSVALNGAEIFASSGLTCNEVSTTTLLTFEFPPNQVSDIIFVIAASVPNALSKRRLFFAIGDQELATLPEGLSYKKTW